MRPLLLAALTFFTATVADAAKVLTDQWLEAPVTLSLAFSHVGEEQLKDGKNDTATRTVPLISTRFGNREILDALVARGSIPQTKGWRLVARWDASASAYAFYARTGSGSNTYSVRIPDDLLAFEAISGANGLRQSVRVQGDEITSISSGGETLRVFSRLTVETSALIGNLNGTLTGTGRYVRLAPENETAEFVPNATVIKLQGVYTPAESETVGVVTGALTFGKTNWVRIYQNGPLIDIDLGGGVIVSPN